MLIDLDDREPYGPPDPWLPGRLGRWLARLSRRIRVAGLAGFALLLLVITGLAGGAPIRSGITALFTLPPGARGYGIIDNLIAVVTDQDGPRLSGYRLPQGDLLWTVGVSVRNVQETAFGVTGYPGLFIVAAFEPGSLESRTIAYDAGTGRQLWIRPGRANGLLGSGRLLMVNAAPDTCPTPPCDRLEDYSRVPHEYAAVDLHTGRGSWTRVLSGPQNASVAFDASPGGSPDRMAALDADGRVRLWDLGSGAELASRPVPGPDLAEAVVFLRDLVVVLNRPPGEFDGVPTPMDLTGYDGHTLDPRWQAGVVTTGDVWPCGDRLCLPSSDSTTAIDPQTGGATRLEQAWQWVADLGEGYQLGYPMSVRDGDPRRWVLDRTGRPLFELSHWDALPSWSGRSYSLLAWFRADTSQAWFGVLDVRQRGVRPLGRLSGVIGSCEPVPARGGGYLFCWRAGNRLQVARYST